MLPYKVRCKCVSGLGGGETKNGVLKYVGNCHGVISNYYEGVPLHSGFVNNVFYPIENIKPYLRPMASMTKEEKQESRWYRKDAKSDNFILYMNRYVEWLDSKHFDWRTDGNGKTMIEIGLALEAPEGLYEIK